MTSANNHAYGWLVFTFVCGHPIFAHLSALQQLEISWPTMPRARSAIATKPCIRLVAACPQNSSCGERRRLKAKHLWAGLASQWDKLRARLFTQKVTHLGRIHLYERLFLLQFGTQERFCEAEYRGYDDWEVFFWTIAMSTIPRYCEDCHGHSTSLGKE